jgi:hypothetical protein
MTSSSPPKRLAQLMEKLKYFYEGNHFSCIGQIESLISSVHMKPYDTTIPDITFQLIFCFLPLRELPHIARCCKQWNRLVTAQSFINMFQHKDTVCFGDDIIQNSVAGSFHGIIRKIALMTFSTTFSTVKLLPFNRIVSLEFTMNYGVDNYRGLEGNFETLFKALGPRLCELKVSFYYLNELFNDLPLEVQKLIDSLVLLPELKRLVFKCLFNSKHFLDRLDKLCKGLKDSKLNHLGYFSNIPHQSIDACVQRLNQLSHLQTIGVGLKGTFPLDLQFISLGKWISHLSIFDRSLSHHDVNSVIIQLPHLTSITLKNCSLQHQEIIHELIKGLSSKLENLLLTHTNCFESCKISFPILSKCKNLKSLVLKNIIFPPQDEFDLLVNCKLLETIEIEYRPYPTQAFRSPMMTQALKIPSTTFTRLTKSVIQKNPR